MKKAGLIGYGYWGKILEPVISKYFDLKFIANSKQKYDLNGLDWVFVATPTDTHYDIIKKCLKNNINVFCEKPFTSSYLESHELFELAKKNNLKIFIDNTFLYRKEFLNFKINENIGKIIFLWFKDGPYNDDLINSLLYHDIYLLLDLVKEIELIEIKNKIIEKDFLNISLILNNSIKIEFNYNRNNKPKNKLIYINNEVINFNEPLNNPLDDIIKKISQNNCVLDFKKNNNLTLKSKKLIESILL